MVLVLHDIRRTDNFLTILRDKILISVTKFERLGDDRIKVYKGHKRKPFFVVRKTKGGCSNCYFFDYCTSVKPFLVDSICSKLFFSGIIDQTNIRFEKI